MSRRKLQWKERFRQAGDVNKIMPKATAGRGEWLTSVDIDGKKPVPEGKGKGASVTKPILSRKEQLVRGWCR